MIDLAFTLDTLRACVRRIDFDVDPSLKISQNLENQLTEALNFLSNPAAFVAEIGYGRLNGKAVAMATTYRAQLALRKINANVLATFKTKSDDRAAIVRALKVLLAEGFPYRMYKLDVRRFYESFAHSDVDSVLKQGRIDTATYRVVMELLNHHQKQGNTGLPRGLAISAGLADMMMKSFDSSVLAHIDVFFYRRYVDDLTIITSQREDSKEFTQLIANYLPPGLNFKKNKTRRYTVKTFKAKDAKITNVPVYESFDYLGYRFHVATESHAPALMSVRNVWLDIADSKVAKIKTRLIKVFCSYLHDGDFDLLNRRIRHLTSNISLIDRSRGVNRLAGIHFSYPLVVAHQSAALKDLDKFLRNSLCSSRGRVFSKLNKSINPIQRKQLMNYSFYAGAARKRFFQMSVPDLAQVQRCWKYG